jgi:hypothetical protein
VIVAGRPRKHKAKQAERVSVTDVFSPSVRAVLAELRGKVGRDDLVDLELASYLHLTEMSQGANAPSDETILRVEAMKAKAREALRGMLPLPGDNPVGVPGRNSKLTAAVAEAVLTAIALGMTEADAAKQAGITQRTLERWIQLGRSGAEGYSGFVEALTRARAKRPDAILMRLADYRDYRADDAYLRHSSARDERDARIRKANAEAELAEAKAAAARALTQQGGAGVLLLAEDVLGDMPHDLAARVREHFAVKGLGVVERRDLASGVTDDDVANASPTPPDDEAGP